MTTVLNDPISGFFAALTSKGNNPDRVLIDNLTKFAPSLKSMQWTKANNIVHHVYREVAEVKGIADPYDFDSPITNLAVSFSLNSTNLTPYAGGIDIGQDTANMMRESLDSFFIEQAQLISRDLGQKLEGGIFKNIVRSSVDKNRRWMMYDDVPDTPTNTLVVVTWEGSECCGLYSPAYAKVDGDRLFQLEKLQNGALFSNRKGVPVYGAIFKVVLGLLLANKRMFATVTNVDTKHKDFAAVFPERFSAVMDEMLVNEHTMILMSNRLKTAIGNHYTTKATHNTLVQFDEKCNLRVCGVPVVHSSNIPMTVDWTKIPSLYANAPAETITESPAA